MPMMEKEDFAKGDESSQFCLYCANEDGSVKSCEEIFNGGVEYMKSVGFDDDFAERLCRKNMLRLEYWKGKNEQCLSGPVATDKEFAAAEKQMMGEEK